jgi:hypothetical protein
LPPGAFIPAILIILADRSAPTVSEVAVVVGWATIVVHRHAADAAVHGATRRLGRWLAFDRAGPASLPQLAWCFRWRSCAARSFFNCAQ